MEKKKLILATAIAIPVTVIGWALFRPELLFVNQTVNEKLPTDSQTAAEILASGKFQSYAHETKGKAQFVRVGNKTYLQLTDFHTSNGPDVRVLLLKGTDSNNGKSPDRIELGPIKGNIGTQNYEIPAGTNLDEYQSVSVWCERFSVGFGGATLQAESPKVTSNTQNFQFQLIGLGAPITVTSGKVEGDKAFAGSASIIEENNKRFVETNFTKIGSGSYQIRLVKKESLKVGEFPANTPFEKIGTLVKNKKRFTASKGLDLWLYRSVAIVDSKTQKIVSYVNLRSDQERNKSLSFTGQII
ncbi:hypothetical protein CCB80_02855 [Armatimonadetes bacterium Uphvl-Ar1]|nr:hypothetical protein CCB80_02855 [Armatimonadetes bacterium Uphvl-Ar1]